ncbi:PTS sugar transporter subunit IIA [Oceanobacillus profundus]|jgi:PTS system galactitol-specific IIA component|uniref:PTS sugar transporter subunit IIA n=1 Tax=Oceanobacillus profundus TaxID=372463 RepID=A0A417YNZ8_9BACI|nr:PTS sugar transporter subunit IIA [Oceanobacillus profundus]MBR3119348.1 PTS sugar transporter subunit IIA [Oceanobacillus sp.]PAE30423.1 PTS sugar transporter subunit IIA [Paenibacillus sp. 7884-2]MCM3400328.1 PTS sugar transporter subunit IIA [Oceanobacillus profundus]MDO6451236.1 PTS sugar transporter subunit IIA [Oceanobacillus profundus]RHW35552.1 PTS sugar transporter subunit IIA [Oceanobacillus profundus]
MSELFFNESVILLDVEGDNKEEVLATIGNNLVERGLVKESFVPAIIKREGEFATGLPTAGVSVAIPHTDVEHVNKKTISVAVLKNPVDFVIMGDDSETTPVQLVFMLAMDEAHSQLSLLQKLMQVFQEEDTLKYLVNQKDKTKVKSLLEEKLDFVALEGGER